MHQGLGLVHSKSYKADPPENCSARWGEGSSAHIWLHSSVLTATAQRQGFAVSSSDDWHLGLFVGQLCAHAQDLLCCLSLSQKGN